MKNKLKKLLDEYSITPMLNTVVQKIKDFFTPPNQIDDVAGGVDNTRALSQSKYGRTTYGVRKAFAIILRMIMLTVVVCMLYWTIATDRYVSEAVVIIQNTEAGIVPVMNVGSLLGVSGANNSPDQLLLLEHLLSVDMLKNLDKALDLRSHYSSDDIDLFSRMWDRDCPIEDFYEYFQSRMEVAFDDFAGVLRIRVQAYTPKMAQDIASILVKEGESYMNKLSHQLAQAQVDFLSKQVSNAYADIIKASNALITYQNKEGLASPEAVAESMIEIIAGLETQRTDKETQLAALPQNLVINHPTKIMLRQALEAIEKQIVEEKAKLASVAGRSLNTLIAEHERLQLEMEFKTDVYKTALVALEAGRMEASRTIKQVSVLQSPQLPEEPLEPERLYNAIATLLIGLVLLAMLKLLESIILDHVD